MDAGNESSTNTHTQYWIIIYNLDVFYQFYAFYIMGHTTCQSFSICMYMYIETINYDDVFISAKTEKLPFILHLISE